MAENCCLILIKIFFIYNLPFLKIPYNLNIYNISLNYVIFRAKLEDSLGSIAIFLSWFYLTFLMGQFPNIGIYILMVQNIAASLIKVKY